MADYWKSQGRKYCDFCKCWIADNKPSIEFHEGGKKHKENVSKRLKEIHKSSAKQAKQNKKFESDLKKMENAAMAAYLKDVENNTRDMTADTIIKEKYNNPESWASKSSSTLPTTTRDTVPKFRDRPQQRQSHRSDPCDPMAPPRELQPPRVHQVNAGESKGQAKSGKVGKGKGKGKKNQEEDRPSMPIRKLWYQARSPEGYTYYWHIETNESVWEPPEEGYMSFAEQEEEEKERALQEEFLQQIEQEGAAEKALIQQEQEANAEREKLKEIRKRFTQKQQEQRSEDNNVGSDDNNGINNVIPDEEERPYRRDYSVPEKPDPYGVWQTVQNVKKKSVDLQLPEQKKKTELPVFGKAERPTTQKTFVEKTVTRLKTDGSDDEGAPTTFKKRKFGNRSVRQRVSDE
ncbi:WW domain-binding protein 4 isoform X2 [Prorops nasuta]|uniref:WW domain-binding protein 4 isoform X1 n=1 Tax=Prorops nasuta TaxID=863751 RepID=UPI0034CE0C6C